jgi:hypothetical protein
MSIAVTESKAVRGSIPPRAMEVVFARSPIQPAAAAFADSMGGEWEGVLVANNPGVGRMAVDWFVECWLSA